MNLHRVYKFVAVFVILIVGFIGYQVLAAIQLKGACKNALISQANRYDVFLKNDIPSSSIEAFRSTLLETNNFKTITLVSSEDAINNLKNRNANDPILTQMLGTTNLAPNPELVLLSNKSDLANLDQIQSEIRNQIQTIATKANVSIDRIIIDTSVKTRMNYFETKVFPNASPFLNISAFFRPSDQNVLKLLTLCAKANV